MNITATWFLGVANDASNVVWRLLCNNRTLVVKKYFLAFLSLDSNDISDVRIYFEETI